MSGMENRTAEEDDQQADQEPKGPAASLDDLDAILLDLDGVITETAEVHANSWKEMFDAFLRERASRLSAGFVPFDLDHDYKQFVDGKPRYEGVASFLESRGISLPHGHDRDPPDKETVCGLGNRKNQLFLKAIRQNGVTTYPSSVDFIHKIRRLGLKVAVVTSSRNGREVLEAAGVAQLFDAKVDGIVARECWLDGKPSPDTYLEAARRVGSRPERAAVVEDAVSGIEAGRAGRFGLVVGVSRDGNPRLLQRAGADVVVSDLSELHLGDADAPDPDALDGAPDRSDGHTLENRMQPAPPALEKLDDIKSRIGTRRLAVFLDYDGTLTPIVARPDLAVLSDSMRSTLRTLARACTVVIVSGRERGNVADLVDLEEIVYAGSHGFDIVGPEGTEIQHEEGEAFVPEVKRAATEIGHRVAGIEGVLVEDKKLALAVHFRLVKPQDVPRVEEAVDAVMAQHPLLRKTGGKKVFELRPNIDWDKGKAVLWLLEALELEGDEVLPIYIGDDETDFDAFRALRGKGLSFLVAEQPLDGAADYLLRNPQEAETLLAALSAFLRGELAQ
ncbi:trehalose-phosphatase [Pelagibius sp.]|uniref:trehalose-phosphatase n=1 Tax=Pelagibius sp. TaxID=1931238 RepID=UPI002620A6D2|nr:trehalose-phosphatase [Pelagibius sp.]